MESRISTLLIVLFVIASAVLTGDQLTRKRVAERVEYYILEALKTPSRILDGGTPDGGND